jgi:peptide chain release factor 1
MTDIQDIQKRYDELSAKLSSEQLNNSDRSTIAKEYSFLTNILEKHKEIQETLKNLQDANAQIESTDDSELRQMFKDEVLELESKLKKEKDVLEELMFPADELDKASAFIEIRAGAGGQEAALFVADLMRLYTNYGLKKGWNVSVVDLKGFKEVILHLKGKGIYGHLKYESGVHRVQRVPLTETSGRVHTSTVTVAVFPEMEEEVKFEIDPEDLKIDVYRAGGAGGQHVNKTESAVRITHLPTNVVVTCQDDRSQHKNKEKAMKMLKSRLLVAQKEKQEIEMQQKRKEQVGSGMRAEKTRTYNYPQNRVSDHLAELTLTKLDFIMEGDLDEIIQALQAKEKEDRRKQGIAK